MNKLNLCKLSYLTQVHSYKSSFPDVGYNTYFCHFYEPLITYSVLTQVGPLSPGEDSILLQTSYFNISFKASILPLLILTIGFCKWFVFIKGTRNQMLRLFFTDWRVQHQYRQMNGQTLELVPPENFLSKPYHQSTDHSFSLCFSYSSILLFLLLIYIPSFVQDFLTGFHIQIFVFVEFYANSSEEYQEGLDFGIKLWPLEI